MTRPEPKLGPGPNPPGGITCPGPKPPGPGAVEGSRCGKPCCWGPTGDAEREGPIFILDISPDNAASASAVWMEVTREGGSLDLRELELAGENARGGLMPPLKRSGDGMPSMEGGWLRSCGTEGGREALLSTLPGSEGMAGTGGGGFLDEDGKTDLGQLACTSTSIIVPRNTHA